MPASFRTAPLFLAALVAGSLATAPAARAGDRLDEIADRGYLRAATEAMQEPYEFLRGGEIVGYGRTILDDIAASLGVGLRLHDGPFRSLLPALDAGRYDLVASAMPVNRNRTRRYALTRPIGMATALAVVDAANGDIASPDDLAGQRIGVQRGSSEHEDLTAGRTLHGIPDTSLSTYQTVPDAATALAEGEIDALVIGTTGAARIMRRWPGRFRVVGPLGDVTDLVWAVAAESTDLRDAIDARIDHLRETGQLAAWQRQWFGFTMPLPATGYLPKDAR